MESFKLPPGPPPPRLDVRADLLKIAATCMAHHDIRYYLNGVYIEPREGGGVIIVATDGHRICAVIDASGSISAPTILTLDPKLLRALPRPSFDVDAAAVRPKRDNPTEDAPARVTIESVGTSHLMVLWQAGEATTFGATRVVEGQFPQWRRVVLQGDFKDLKLQANPTYQYRYLADTLAVFKPPRNCYSAWAIAYQWRDDGVILFHIPGHEHVLLGVMPMAANRLEAKFADFAARASDFKPAPIKQPAAEPA